MDFNQPLFFAPNRVWRLYTGGLLLDSFSGTEGTDGHFPEEWLASTVYASNGDHSSGPDEGLTSVLADDKKGPTLPELLKSNGEQILGREHYKKYGNNTAVLCKYLDSAIRLPIQCHPDVKTAMQLYNSPFGKTESWHIISTRKINNEEPYILLGFKPGIKPADFAEAVSAQDLSRMIGMLHKIKVNPGDTYFVPPRMPHAIGTGVFMLEVQEPSDWVIQPEHYCADIKLNDHDMWGPLSPEDGLKVFSYEGLEKDELMKRISPSDTIIHKSDSILVTELIGARHTSSFGLWKVTLTGTSTLELPVDFAIFVVEDGTGTINWPGGSKKLKRSEYFLKSAALKKYELSTDKKLDLLVCMPPVITKS